MVSTGSSVLLLKIVLQNLDGEKVYRQMTWFLQQRNCKEDEREMGQGDRDGL